MLRYLIDRRMLLSSNGKKEIAIQKWYPNVTGFSIVLSGYCKITCWLRFLKLISKCLKESRPPECCMEVSAISGSEFENLKTGSVGQVDSMQLIVGATRVEQQTLILI